MRGRGRWWAAAGLGAAVVVVAVAIVLATRSGAPGGRGRRGGRAVGPAGAAGRLDPALPAPTGQAFGVNVNLLFNDFSYTAAQIGAQLTAVHLAGATLARSDALWEATEPHAPVDGRHTYDWSFDDPSPDRWPPTA